MIRVGRRLVLLDLFAADLPPTAQPLDSIDPGFYLFDVKQLILNLLWSVRVSKAAKFLHIPRHILVYSSEFDESLIPGVAII